jgi:hypothetical protein
MLDENVRKYKSKSVTMIRLKTRYGGKKAGIMQDVRGTGQLITLCR